MPSSTKQWCDKPCSYFGCFVGYVSLSTSRSYEKSFVICVVHGTSRTWSAPRSDTNSAKSWQRDGSGTNELWSVSQGLSSTSVPTVMPGFRKPPTKP